MDDHSYMKLPRSHLILVLGLAFMTGAVSARAQQLAAPAVSTTSPFTGTGIVSPAAPYNALILQQIHAMPLQGGYSSKKVAFDRLSAATSLGSAGLSVEAGRAMPSFCSEATYLVFLKTVAALNRLGEVPLDENAMRSLLVSGQPDGHGLWGRWNANGPGTARLFYEMGLGRNFSDFSQAVPGDFMKIFWSDAVGPHEHGHSVIYLGEETLGGVESVRFWSSNIVVGYGEKTVPRKKISAAIFSRLTAPRNLERAPSFQGSTDPYLASLLSKDSSLAEARRECGM